MSLLTIFIIIGFSAVGVLVFAIFYDVYKNTRLPYDSPACIPTINILYIKKKSKRMVKAVRNGEFLMHTQINNAPPFNDNAYLESYTADIQEPSVITYIKNASSGCQYE
jgi:hypothetical protein